MLAKKLSPYAIPLSDGSAISLNIRSAPSFSKCIRNEMSRQVTAALKSADGATCRTTLNEVLAAHHDAQAALAATEATIDDHEKALAALASGAAAADCTPFVEKAAETGAVIQQILAKDAGSILATERDETIATLESTLGDLEESAATAQNLRKMAKLLPTPA